MTSTACTEPRLLNYSRVLPCTTQGRSSNTLLCHPRGRLPHMDNTPNSTHNSTHNSTRSIHNR
jgi:hypothetical protein